METENMITEDILEAAKKLNKEYEEQLSIESPVQNYYIKSVLELLIKLAENVAEAENDIISINDDFIDIEEQLDFMANQ